MLIAPPAFTTVACEVIALPTVLARDCPLPVLSLDRACFITLFGWPLLGSATHTTETPNAASIPHAYPDLP